MSRERFVSLDRNQRKQMENEYISGRRSLRSRADLQHVSSSNFQGGGSSYAVSDFNVDNIREQDSESMERTSNGFQDEYCKVRPFQMEDLPDELLDEYEEPSFYDIPPNASFEEVMCTMASPPVVQPQTATSTASETLDKFRVNVAQAIEIDDLRKRMAAHIGGATIEETTDTAQVDDIRKRIASHISEKSPELSFCSYKIPPLPEDPYAIPPPPKDAKDVVNIIRRAQAIARLKTLEEAQAAAKIAKGAVRKAAKGFVASKELLSKKLASGSQQDAVGLQKVTAKMPAFKLTKKVGLRKHGIVGKKKVECLSSLQHPPDYVPDEWAAAILRTRKLAGLKTTNPKLLPKPKSPPPLLVKSSIKTPSLKKSPPRPTFEDIMRRAAAIRAKTDIAKAALRKQQTSVQTPSSPTLQEELEEYEALEELYGAIPSSPLPVTEQTVIDLKSKIDTLQQQLLHTPPQAETSSRAEEEIGKLKALDQMYDTQCQSPATGTITADIRDRFTPIFEVPSVLRYQDLLKRREFLVAAAAQANLKQCLPENVTEKFEDDLYGQPMFKSVDSPLPITPPRAFSSPVSRYGTPLRTTTPVRTHAPLRQFGFDDGVLQNIDMPDFDVNDISEFAFSEEALADAGFEIGNELTSLSEISMPDFEGDISIDEFGLEDVSFPELCDLSISGTELALEPDYPLEVSTEEEDDAESTAKSAEDEPSKHSGFLTTMVNAVVDRFKNIFSLVEGRDDHLEEESDELNLDSSLPNMFQITPPTQPKSKTHSSEKPTHVEQKPESSDCSIVIPPHPKDPKDYKAIIKRAQAIQKKKSQEIAKIAVASLPSTKEKKRKREIKSTIPKSTAPVKRKMPLQKNLLRYKKPSKVYPPGEYSPSELKAIARARSLAGLKNRSALLNPEETARTAELEAAREAELAAIEKLPPVERMRKKIEGLKKQPGALPRPSIEVLGTLEAIRASLPVAEAKKRKWRPAGRLRADRRVKPEDIIFTKDFGRVLIPTKKSHKKKGWREIDVMSPIVEEAPLQHDFIEFSPLKPQEGQLRLRYLKEQAARRAAESVKALEEAQDVISVETETHNYSDTLFSKTCETPKMSPLKFSPIKLQSPSTHSPRTEETRQERVVTKIGPNGGEERIRKEVIETSVIENGEVHTSTKQVTTKTDEFGNVTCHIQEGKGVSGEEEAFPEDIEDIEPPDFLDTSDIPSPEDPLVPTPAEIINRIRAKVRQKLEFALPNIPQPSRSPTPSSPVLIDFPEDLTDEDLFGIEAPKFDITPRRTSPQPKAFTPIEKDTRMYAWGEMPTQTPPPPTIHPLIPKISSPSPAPKSPVQISIPSHPKDPKDYKAMVKRAQAIQKLKKQEEELIAKTAPPSLPPTGKIRKVDRVPIPRGVGALPKDSKKLRKRMILKKRDSKVVPKKETIRQVEEEDHKDIPAELPLLPQDYREAVARARLIYGLKNRTAALNPEIAAKKAAEEAEKAAFEALSEHEKIKKRMENIRRLPAEKRRIKPSADILGTIAAIRANLPLIEEVLRQPSRSSLVDEASAADRTLSPRTPLASSAASYTPQAPIRVRHSPKSPCPSRRGTSIDEFECTEQLMEARPVTSEVCLPVQQINKDASLNRRNTSPLRTCVSPSAERLPSTDEAQISPNAIPVSKAESCINLSFENFETMPNLSLDEFEFLEAEAQKLYNYETPKRKQRHLGRQLALLFPKTPRSIETRPRTTRPSRLSNTPCVSVPSLQLASQRPFEEQGVLEEGSILGNETLVRPHITPRPKAKRGSVYYDEMEDFRVPVENVVLDTSLLMPGTPPKNLKEKFERIKRAQTKRITSPKYTQQVDTILSTPVVEFSPIRLISPSVVVPTQYEWQTSPIPTPAEDELLINFDCTSQRQVAVPKQFRDLEDMPFDELEYELEPSLANVSLEKPLTPPPRPSDIIRKIRSKINQNLTDRTQTLPSISPAKLKIPEELPEEELLELSAPSFLSTPPQTPPERRKSPRVSLPMIFELAQEDSQQLPLPPPLRKINPMNISTSPKKIIEAKIPLPRESQIIIPPHPKDPKDYAAMVRRAKAIYKLKKKEEAEKAAKDPLLQPIKKNGRVPISRWQEPLPKKVSVKPRRKLVLRKRVQQPVKNKQGVQQRQSGENEERECPAEPPTLPQEYRDAVARARLIHGLKNRTAALNPKIAAKIAARKAAEEAAAVAYAALSEHEKIKARMEHLRRKPCHRRGVKPTIEQIAYLEALKQTNSYQCSPASPKKPTTPLHLSVTSNAPIPRQLSLTPNLSKMNNIELDELAEFEALEQFEMPSVCSQGFIQENVSLTKPIADLEKQLLETENIPQAGDVSLAEFEALEAIEAPFVACPPQTDIPALDINQIISDLEHRQLATPPRKDLRERYKQLLSTIQDTPPTPVISPVKTPEIRYSPLTLSLSPLRDETMKRAEKSTTQITKSGNNTIKEQVIERSELVDGGLQHFTTHVTTTTNPQGNITCQINESKRVSARDCLEELKNLEYLEDIKEPSFLDTTPVTPIERPRPRDIIDRVQKQVKESYRPEVPTGHLIELRTPPRMLPLPEDITEVDLFDYSCPEFERTPTKTPVRTPSRSPARSPDVSIPHLFEATPTPPTPPIPSISPLRHRIPSPEGPIIIPSHPKDPMDFKAMCRRARKIQEQKAQEEAELRAAVAAAIVVAETAKTKKKERVPISRWTAPPPRKPGTRKKLVIKKRGDVVAPKKTVGVKQEKLQSAPKGEETEYPTELPSIPDYYAQEVARARILAGLKNRTAALNPKVAAREAAKAKAAKKAQEVEEARLATLNVPPPLPIRDYETVLSRMAAMREKGIVHRGQPSISSAAYLNAVKSALQLQQQLKEIYPKNEGEKATYESPKSRYKRIIAERAIAPSPIAESPINIVCNEDIPYSPLRLISPRTQIDLPETVEDYKFDLLAFESLQELELDELEEPSFMDVSQYLLGEDQYIPLTPPPTPPPQLSAIISGIREKYQQKNTVVHPESPPLAPVSIEFPEDLPEEELFEQSVPSFAQSPLSSGTPIKSPNISIPYYFEQTPPSKAVILSRSSSPTRTEHLIRKIPEVSTEASPPFVGIYPGVKVKTPEGPIRIPPHPKDPNDIVAMIRRAQMIHKLRSKQTAEKAALEKPTKVRIPMSRKVAKSPPKKDRLMGRLVVKKKIPAEEAKPQESSSQRMCPTEPPELPAEYIAEVAKARKMAGLKNKTALFNPKVAATQEAIKLAIARAEAEKDNVKSKSTPPLPDYATIMERAEALRAAKAKVQKRPTARELTNRQHLINRQQRQERKRLLHELNRLRSQQGFEEHIDLVPLKTPPPARERLQAIKSKIQTETPTSFVYTLSPVKTPDIIDLPSYQPLKLPPTPPYQFLENVCIPDIENISMQFSESGDYDMNVDTAEIEDFEFQIAEAEAFSEFEYEPEFKIAQNAFETDFDMVQRIQMLQNQLDAEVAAEKDLEEFLMTEAAACENLNEKNYVLNTAEAKELQDIQSDFDSAERIEIIHNQLLQPPSQGTYSPRVANAVQEFNMEERIKTLQKQLLQYPPQQQKQNLCPDVCQNIEEDIEYDQQDVYDDDFEIMERKCI